MMSAHLCKQGVAVTGRILLAKPQYLDNVCICCVKAFAELTRWQKLPYETEGVAADNIRRLQLVGGHSMRLCPNQTGIHSTGLPDTRNLFCDGRLLASNQSHSIAVYVTQKAAWRMLA